MWRKRPKAKNICRILLCQFGVTWERDVVTVRTGSFWLADLDYTYTDNKWDAHLSLWFQGTSVVSLSPSLNSQFCCRFSSLWLTKLKQQNFQKSPFPRANPLVPVQEQHLVPGGFSTRTMSVYRNSFLLAEVVGLAHRQIADRNLFNLQREKKWSAESFFLPWCIVWGKRGEACPCSQQIGESLS